MITGTVPCPIGNVDDRAELDREHGLGVNAGQRAEIWRRRKNQHRWRMVCVVDETATILSTSNEDDGDGH